MNGAEHVRPRFSGLTERPHAPLNPCRTGPDRQGNNARGHSQHPTGSRMHGFLFVIVILAAVAVFFGGRGGARAGLNIPKGALLPLCAAALILAFWLLHRLWHHY